MYQFYQDDDAEEDAASGYETCYQDHVGAILHNVSIIELRLNFFCMCRMTSTQPVRLMVFTRTVPGFYFEFTFN